MNRAHENTRSWEHAGSSGVIRTALNQLSTAVRAGDMQCTSVTETTNAADRVSRRRLCRCSWYPDGVRTASLRTVPREQWVLEYFPLTRKRTVDLGQYVVRHLAFARLGRPSVRLVRRTHGPATYRHSGAAGCNVGDPTAILASAVQPRRDRGTQPSTADAVEPVAQPTRLWINQILVSRRMRWGLLTMERLHGTHRVDLAQQPVRRAPDPG